MKYLTRTVSNFGKTDEAGAFSPVHRNRTESHHRPKRYSFLDDACMARAMQRL
jgi:hypothetical protein